MLHLLELSLAGACGAATNELRRWLVDRRKWISCQHPGCIFRIKINDRRVEKEVMLQHVLTFHAN